MTNSTPTITTKKSLTIDEDTASAAVTFTGSDADGDTLTFTFSEPNKGTVTDNGNGTFTYTPDTNANGSDSFTITASDGTSSASETVNITITPVNDAPIIDTTFKINTVEGRASSAIIFSAIDVENDAVSFTFGTPSKGTVVDNNDGTFTYIGSGNNNGEDSFTITANDGTDTSTRTVTVIIQALTGTAEADTLTGTDQNDTIRGYAGDDVISAGAGDDTIYGGAGDDIIDAGDGDDDVYVDNTELVVSSTQSNTLGGVTFNAYYSSLITIDNVDGGDGFDTLIVNDTSSVSQKYLYFPTNSVSNIEKIETGGYTNAFIAGSTWDQVSTWEVGTHWLNIYSDEANQSIDLSKLTSIGAFKEVSFVGEYDTIDASNLQISGIELLVGRNPVQHFLGSSNNDIIVYGSGYNVAGYTDLSHDFNINLGIGDDTFTVRTYGNNDPYLFTGQWDFGPGNDSLIFAENQYNLIDLSGVNLTGLETLNAGQGTILLSEAQYNGIATKHGNIFAKNNTGKITLTENDDVFTGSGNEKVIPGSGADTISLVETVYYEGNQSEFTITRDATDPRLTVVEHSGGSKSQGTDTLENILNLEFSDGSKLVIDDYADRLTSGTRDISYGEIISGAFEFKYSSWQNKDVDVFTAYFAPSSPIKVNFTSNDLNGSHFYVYDSEGNRLNFLRLDRNYIEKTLNTNQALLPGYNTADGFKEFQGGNVTLEKWAYDFWYQEASTSYASYDFELELIDDKTNSENTRGSIDPQTGIAFGYIGDLNDKDWISTDLAAGSTYLFQVLGKSSGNGTLLDPALKIYHESDLVNAIATTTVPSADLTSMKGFCSVPSFVDDPTPSILYENPFLSSTRNQSRSASSLISP